MGKNSKDSNLMWQIRNNVRKNNFKAVADTVKNVIYMDEENPEKEQLMKKIYIDVIEPWVRGANVEQEVPRQYEEMFIDFAKKLDESSEQEKILNMLRRIENSKNSKTQKKVRRQISLMGLTQELLKDADIDAETVEKYADELEENTDNSTYVELISKLFGKEFPIEILNVEQLEKTLGAEGHKHREGNGTIKELKEYPDEIKVDKRLKFLIEELDVEPTGRFAENGIFSGSILLDIKDSDMVIVERLFEIYADGTYDLANQQSGKASSTYILPKDKILKMIEAEAKSKVRKELEKETEDEGLGKWKPIRHTVSWMNRVKDRVDHAKEIQQEEITNLEDGISEESKIDSNLEEKEELGDTLYETSPSKEETLQLDGENAEELSTEQLEEQLKMLKEQNKKKAQLYREQLLEQIKQEQQKGLQLDKQIEEAKHTIDIGE